MKENNPDTIYFAGGCFWGTEHFMRQIPGVLATQVGYANSAVPYPSYKDVCTGYTNAAEAVEVVYDSGKVSLRFLVRLYFMTIDPTSVNRQGNDAGTQYRTGIYYTTGHQRSVIKAEIEALRREYAEPVVVEVKPLENFYEAEDYHQDYLVKNPSGYCHINPKLFDIARHARIDASPRFVRPGDEELRRSLTPIQWEVTQHSATEPPYDNEYYNNRRKGIYVDITTGEPLFASSAKFDSGCGWPSFSRALPTADIVESTDHSHGMVRTEVRTALGNAHLGHLFPDGPRDLGGMRYCINSAALRFVPLEEMASAGYADFIKYVQ